MIKYIKNETDIFFPSFIINIVNVRFIDITSVIFDICTINNDIILSDIKFDLSLKINILYNDIFNRIKLIKFLIDKNQLKILYQNELILCNNNELMTIFNNLLI